MEATKFYILQQYIPNGKKVYEGECTNVYYAEIDGKDKIWLAQPERATRFNTIGEAMKVSARLSTENKGIYFKAIPIYDESVLTKKNKSLNKN